MNLRVHRFNTTVPGNLQEAAFGLAVGNAEDLSAYHVEDNDPFLPLVRAEVGTRLLDDFQMMDTPHIENGVSSKVEAIFVLEETLSQRKLIGFAKYKPRSPAYTCASIGYMVVAKNYRGKGILRMMMEEILSQYPILALDCRPSLVPLYEKFGFKPTGVQGTHISMATGPITGQMMSLSATDLMRYPALVQAKQVITASLGSGAKAGYSKFNEQQELAMKEAEEFMASRIPKL